MDRSELLALWAQRGQLSYQGEGVTQLQHGWQCARLARQAGASRALQLASWLHDLGHLMTGLDGTPSLRGIDDTHESIGAAVLEPLFGAAVSRPVALHVAAKRFLVATQPAYRGALSSDAARSLALQGGAFSAEACRNFVAQPWARDALRLRVWDDQAKVAALRPPSDKVVLAELTAVMDWVAPRA
jgi:phosphonate degradation associated HDIG domain protein